MQANANDGAGFNRYRYAANNPYRFVDPDGRQESIVDYMKYSDPVQRKAEEEAALVTLRFLEDIIPGWGDAKGFKEAYEDPSTINILAAGAGVLGPIGDGVGKILKHGGNALDTAGSLWTTTKNTTSAENAFRHFKDHGDDFEAVNAVDYVRMAQDFLRNPPDGTLTKIRSNGDVVRYNPATNTFGVMDKTGTPRTFYKPDPQKHGHPTNLDYFNAQ